MSEPTDTSQPEQHPGRATFACSCGFTIIDDSDDRDGFGEDVDAHMETCPGPPTPPDADLDPERSYLTVHAMDAQLAIDALRFRAADLRLCAETGPEHLWPPGRSQFSPRTHQASEILRAGVATLNSEANDLEELADELERALHSPAPTAPPDPVVGAAPS